MKNLQGQKNVLRYELDYLKTKREKLEAAIRTDRGLLQETLTRGLMNLKQQRPDLFYISGEEQIIKLIAAFLK